MMLGVPWYSWSCDSRCWVYLGTAEAVIHDVGCTLVQLKLWFMMLGVPRYSRSCDSCRCVTLVQLKLWFMSLGYLGTAEAVIHVVGLPWYSWSCDSCRWVTLVQLKLIHDVGLLWYSWSCDSCRWVTLVQLKLWFMSLGVPGYTWHFTVICVHMKLNDLTFPLCDSWCWVCLNTPGSLYQLVHSNPEQCCAETWCFLFTVEEFQFSWIQLNESNPQATQGLMRSELLHYCIKSFISFFHRLYSNLLAGINPAHEKKKNLFKFSFFFGILNFSISPLQHTYFWLNTEKERKKHFHPMWTDLFSASSLSIRFQSRLTSDSCSCSKAFSNSTFSRRNCTTTQDQLYAHQKHSFLQAICCSFIKWFLPVKSKSFWYC